MTHNEQHIFDVIVNDGSGNQCGMTYAQRVETVVLFGTKNPKRALDRFYTAALIAGRREDVNVKTTHMERCNIARELLAYYVAHVAEMTYTVKPGNIAAMAHVTLPSGKTLDFIYCNEHDAPTPGVLQGEGEQWADMPQAVQAAVKEHFRIVFAFPVEKRGAYLKVAKERQVIA